MYVTTFYSFKGGVGRSMALANAAVELSRRGRRVLVVDFDLEAPGLDTFDVLRPEDEVPGIIDFVREYLDTNRAPDASGFMARIPERRLKRQRDGESEPDAGDQTGQIWIMPSGAQRPAYATQLHEIDWAKLYEERDGYLLFEDLKAQWKQIVKPDYVLIDSRTGHTDTGGICTRQLPNAVAILFFPNEQNLRGLTKVVRDIRAEADGDVGEGRREPIELHFIMSNVPDLDDEDQILERKIREFRDQLEVPDDFLVVHRYDSLSLLKQAVFTLQRPTSRLAKEYCAVVDEVVGRNVDDRDGALAYIERAGSAWRRRGTWESRVVVLEEPSTLRKRLGEIEKTHATDGEVLFATGALREDDPRVERDASLFDRAIAAEYDEPAVRLRRAEVRAANGDSVGARDDAMRALRGDAVALPMILEALDRIEGRGTENVDSEPNLREAPEIGQAQAVAATPAVASLDVPERIKLAAMLDRSSFQIEVSKFILSRIVDDATSSEEQRSNARGPLALRLIVTGACREASKLLRYGKRDVEDMDVGDAFNYGMAEWGATGEIAPAPFERVVKLQEAKSGSDDANYWQCMAVAYWVTGRADAAAEFVDRADAALRGAAFSCWRYTSVPAKAFREDLDDIRALIDGDTERLPHFMRRGSSSAGADAG